MNSFLKKAVRTLTMQIRTRGLYITFLMNLSHITGMARGYWYKLLYFRNIQSSLYAMEGKSKIEIFNKRARVRIGKFVFIRKNASIRLDFNGKLFIDDKVFINDNCNINCVNKISIGKNTKIAPNVSINDHDHNYKKTSDQHLLIGEIQIGSNVWIGSNVVILRDTFIGNNAVIAAGSVVKGHVAENTLFMNERNTRQLPILDKSKSLSS